MDTQAAVTAPWDAACLKEAVKLCTTYARTGFVLAWLLVASQDWLLEDCIVHEFVGAWKQNIAESKSCAGRARGATFPLRVGGLRALEEVLTSCALTETVVESLVSTWGHVAWAYVSMWALNRLAGFQARPPQGPWSKAERLAVNSLEAAAKRRCSSDVPHLAPREDLWQKDVASKLVGYNGEEISICHELTFEQVLPALPPEDHGGCINCLDWVGNRTKEFLLNPDWLLKDPKDVSLPKMPGKVHVKREDLMPIANELVKRHVCSWIPLEKVYSVGGVRVLNGLFGVRKSQCLSDGRPVLRLIMNLTGSNETQLQLEGGCNTLPSIPSWQSLVLDGKETLSLHQSDMCSAFYLFRIPASWQPHLAFNVVVDGSVCGGLDKVEYCLACNVIPMGWLNSVGIMQEISERLLASSSLGLDHRIARGHVIPPWLNIVLDHAKQQEKAWWHVYLDNYAAGERILPQTAGDSARACHEAAEKAWREAGVASSDKKRIEGASRITELGAEIDGEQGTLGISTEKMLNIIHGTFWMITSKFLNRKTVQVMAGRWVFALQFRRPAMSVLDRTWRFVGGNLRMGSEMRALVKSEFLSLILLSPVLHCNLGASISPTMICTDASEKGGSVEYSHELTNEGRDFLQAVEKNEMSKSDGPAPILLVSLFNGIGGTFRAYDIAGVSPLARIAVDVDDAANRVTSHRWPGVIVVKDVRSITRSQVQEWSRKFLQAQEVHIWGGWPCVDLSAVKFNRQNLAGPQSSLFWEIPRIKALFEEEFGSSVLVKYVLENVASMDESAAQEITQAVGVTPYRLDCVDAVPMRRPRFAWTSETVEGYFPDVEISNKRYWREITAKAAYPLTEQWITEGYQWDGESEGAVFPTCLKSIPRQQPPPRPAGLEKADAETKDRWRQDSYRYPPYQYARKFLITSSSTWRLLNATEKELLMGYGYNHTKTAWSASKIKQNPVAFSDTRHKLLGDAFSIYSFVIMAVICAQKFLPVISYQRLVLRMGMAPGFRGHL